MIWSSHTLTHNLIHVSNRFLTYHFTGLLPLKLLKLDGFIQFKLNDYWEYTPCHGTMTGLSPTQETTS